MGITMEYFTVSTGSISPSHIEGPPAAILGILREVGFGGRFGKLPLSALHGRRQRRLPGLPDDTGIALMDPTRSALRRISRPSACAGASADTLSAPRRDGAWRAYLASGCDR